ncbi:EmrB/QacA subfamily drug resistance transporter [Salirhabdus euzebyi]|uniref:EmrB/QacA subfamily drug resistance transporter n=1 Tax=Salirhabdus euzebyi TaxID=394506 RepID=A0A841Q985_9BACI|nr:MDR family MFS transporter [Salirhabdus euzebyi]MBB6454864.1 EmrB/QacA subfamily drug resistance transporter [Salirhabdus euzebyi]
MSKLPTKWLVVISVLFGTFTVILNNSMLNPILPHFIDIFNADAVSVGWVLTIFMVAMGMTMPITGYLGDRFGKKKIYIVGLILFTIGSIVGAVSQTLSLVIIARAIQGIAGGLMLPNAMALIFTAFPQNERGLAVGIYGIAAMVAPAIGPTIGGLMTEFLQWQFLFLINIPFAVVGIFISSKYLKPTKTKPNLKFDLVGFVLVTAGVGAILYALGRGSTWELLTQTSNIFLIIFGLIFIFIFVKYEWKQEQPLLDLSVFKVRTYRISIFITASASIGLFSGLFLLPLLMQEVYGYSLTETGLLFLPFAVCSGIFMTIGGKLLDLKGPKAVVPIGLGVMAVSTILLGFLDITSSYWYILFLNAVRGIGMGFGNMPATTAGMNAIPQHLVAQGSAMNNVLRQITSSFGIVCFAIYYEVRRAQVALASQIGPEEAALQAINEAFIVSGVILLITVPGAFLLKGTKEQEGKTASE